MYPHNLYLSIFPDVAAELSLIGELGSLSALSGTLLISDYVNVQLQESGINIEGSHVVTMTGEADLSIFDQAGRSNPGLGIADIGALAVALKSNAGVLTNDALVRRVANSLGLCPWGTLRLLEYAVAVGVIVVMQALAIFEELAALAIWMNLELRAAFRNTDP